MEKSNRKWEKPNEYTNNQVDKSGNFLAKNKSCGMDKNQIISIFNNWRKSHAYPMHIMMMTLKNIARGLDKNAICFQRLKRVHSIIYKLKRYTIKLSQMQDIAGCRIIMPNIELTREMSDIFIGRKKKHKRIKKRGINYINNPKPDGYRGIHLVYEYNSTNKGAKIYNGKMVEIQIRSQLQHSWATAVETVDLFSDQKLKFGNGDSDWERFFALMSSAFAIEEGSPLVDGTPENKLELYSEINKLSGKLKVNERMSGWAQSLDQLKSADGRFFILMLDIDKKEISFISEKDEKGLSKLLDKYFELEEMHKDNDNYDVVLVIGENAKDLRKAYPNYFADTTDFLRHLYDIKMTIAKG